MNCTENDSLYIISRRKAIIFYIISLFLSFFKAILFIFDILSFCILINLILLFMIFGYFGIISSKPSLIHAEVYIGLVYVGIMLDFLISFVCCYYIYKLEAGYFNFMHIKRVDYNYFYSIFTLIIVFCLLSTIFNIFSIYYSIKFKKLLKPFSKKNEKKKSLPSLRSWKYQFAFFNKSNDMGESYKKKKKEERFKEDTEKRKKKEDICMNVVNPNDHIYNEEENLSYLNSEVKSIV